MSDVVIFLEDIKKNLQEIKKTIQENNIIMLETLKLIRGIK